MFPRDDREFVLAGINIHIRLHSTETAGKLAIIEERVAPGAGSPRHILHTTAAIYLLDGQPIFTRGDATIAPGVGDVIEIPPGMPRNVTNTSAHEARFLLIIAPAGYEQFLQELHGAGTRLAEAPQLIHTISARFGVELL